MSRFALWMALLLSLGATSAAYAQTGAVQNHCYLGGKPAIVSGLPSTNYQQGIVPGCTVNVYLTGTQTKATIYSDGNETPLSNPFTANSVVSVDPGGWIFWAATSQGLDIVMSGGVCPNCYATPVTLTDVYPSGSPNPGGPFLPLAGGTMTGALSGATSTWSGIGMGTWSGANVSTASALSAAFSAACNGTTPGDLVLAPGQTITLSATLTLSGLNNCTFEPNGLHIATAGGLNASDVVLQNSTGFHMKGALYIDGNQSGQTAGSYGDLLKLSNVNSSDFDSLYLTNAGDTCLYLYGSSKNKFNNVDYHNCGASSLADPNLQGAGVWLDVGSSDNQIAKVYGDTNSGRAGISVSGEVATPSIGNKVTVAIVTNSSQKGIQVWDQAPYTEFGHVDISNTGNNVAGAGMYVSCNPTGSGGDGGCPNHMVLGSGMCSACGNNGFELSSNYSNFGPIVSNSTVLCSGSCSGEGAAAGVYSGGQYNVFTSIDANLNAGAGVVEQGSYNSFGTLTLFDNGAANPGSSYGGLQVDGFSGGAMHDTFAGVVSGNTTTTNQGWGVIEANGAANNSYGVAQLQNNHVAPYAISSSSVLFSTIAPSASTYVSSATVSCPSSGVPFTVAYGSATGPITLTLPSTCPNNNSTVYVSNTSSGLIDVSATGPANNYYVPSNASLGFVYNSGFWFRLTPAPPFAGTTPSIGGSVLAVGNCSTGTVTIPGSTEGVTAHGGTIQVNPANDPNGPTTQNYNWYGYFTATDVVTVKVCALAAGTPAATPYYVSVLQP